MAGTATMRGLFMFTVSATLALCILAIALRSMRPAPVEMFDVDGPSPRDPSRAAWQKAGHGTTYWMEHVTPRHVTGHVTPLHKGLMGKHAPAAAAHKAGRGRRDRPFDSFIRNAPTEVSQALDIPLGEVQAMANKYKSRFSRDARGRHAAHRAGGMLKEVELKNMAECNGKAEKCDPLAENIVAVAEAIQEECFELYFQEKEYYDCVDEHGGPLCDQVSAEFPNMCAKYSYKTDHGYIGSEDPANTRGELCQACYQLKTSNCFADYETVTLDNGNTKMLRDLQAGEVIAARDLSRDTKGLSRVIFTHAHPDLVHVVTLTLESGKTLSLSPAHPLPTLPPSSSSPSSSSSSSFSSSSLTEAGRVVVGESVMVEDKNGVTTDKVVAVSRGAGHVTYFVLDDAKRPLVSSVVAAAESTLAGPLESLPFQLLDRLAVLSLPAVKASLGHVLDSPLLSSLESLLSSLLALPPSPSPSSPSMLPLGFAPVSFGA